MIETLNRTKFFVPRSSRKYACFSFAAALCCWVLMLSNAFVVSGAGATTSGSQTQTQTDSDDNSLSLNVIELTSTNFGSTVGARDGNVWLIEFYTPTCSHCVNFSASYRNIASTFHKKPEDKVRVARVNCSVEKALMTRFGIESFPSFFLVSGWDVYEFDGNRNVSTLIEFAKGGYKKRRVGAA
mmetsp:Transcript_101762/g.206769  ORF Transcript_101762/g.206769 Transcript_101762/m.206769 type:complete len:184 (-) Transcript_101762:3777-4328(-)